MENFTFTIVAPSDLERGFSADGMRPRRASYAGLKGFVLGVGNFAVLFDSADAVVR